MVVAPTTANITASHGQSFAASSLFTVNDPSVIQYDFWDTGAGGGHFLMNNRVLNTNRDNYVSAAQLAQVTYQSGSGADTLWVRVSDDGTQWSNWSPSFTVSAPVDTGPVVTASNVTATTPGQVFAASSLFSATDPNGNPITQYVLYDWTSGSGYWTVNGVAQPCYTDIYITAAQLSQAAFHSATSGSDLVGVSAFDGTRWSPLWTQFTVAAAPPPPPPVVTASNVTATTPGQVFAASSLFSATDPNGNPITQYVVYDWTSGSGYWTVNGVAQPCYTDIYITAAQLSQAAFHSATSGSDLVGVSAFDGTRWSPLWTQFTVAAAPPPPPPVVTASNVTATTPGQVFAASSLFSATDPNGNPITQYVLYDWTSGSGYWTVNGVAQPCYTDIYITAAQLSQAAFHSATSGSDLVGVSAFDGTRWSPLWTQFTVAAAPPPPPPVVTASNVTATTPGQVFAASSLFSATDPNGNPITQYVLYDWTSGSGYWTVNGVAQPCYTDIYITAAQLSQAAFHSATSGSDLVGVSAFDGTRWSPLWTQFTVAAAPPPPPPVVTASNVTATTAGQVFAASSLFSATDPNGNPITQYVLYDWTSGSGYWTVNGVAQPCYTDIYITAAQLSQAAFHSATSGSDLVGVSAFDGTRWSPLWTQFTVAAAPPPPPPVVTASNVTATIPGQVYAASSLFSATDPNGNPITQYVLYDWTSGSGYWTVNGVAQPCYTDIYITAAQLSQAAFHSATSGSDLVGVSAFDGTRWSPLWTQFTVAAPVANRNAEITSAYSGTFSFAADTGLLAIDNSSTFSGTIGGQLAPGNMIDLLDVTAGANATIAYSGNNAPGTLSVNDGTHIANIALLGNYIASSFVAASDGHGGTLVSDPAPTGSQGLLTAPHG